MLDVLIAGAGPAGAAAGLLLARSGARVVIVDRERFPREVACAGLLDDASCHSLQVLGVGADLIAGAPRIWRTLVTGPTSRWMADARDGFASRVVPRASLDLELLEAAVAAGARFEGGVMVRRPLRDDKSGLVRGAVLSRRGSAAEIRMPAVLTIGADGRHSVLARSAGLRGQVSSRRWAFSGDIDAAKAGVQAGQAELHVRRGWYLGVVPAGGGVARLVIVVPAHAAGRAPDEIVRRALADDRDLAVRFGRVPFVSSIRVTGPLLTHVAVPGVPGLLLAGDAAGAVDPLTVDGVKLAIASGQLAASEAARVIDDGTFSASPWRLAGLRKEALGASLRLNRWAARLADSPAMLDVASKWAMRFPAFARRVVSYAAQRSREA